MKQRQNRHCMLILDDPDTWPLDIVNQLRKDHIVTLLQTHGFIEDVKYDPALKDIFADVDRYVKSHSLRGYHGTKQLPDRPYKETGLRILDPEVHHKEFLSVIRGLVDDELYHYIEEKLKDFRADNDSVKYREARLHFCLTRKLALQDSGMEDFYRYYGGEAVYMEFYSETVENDKRVLNLLEKLGEPVIVEVNINICNLIVSPKIVGDMQFYYGPTLVSHFAQSINPKFYIEELEGYVTSDVKPTDIVEVHPREDFGKKYLRC